MYYIEIRDQSEDVYERTRIEHDGTDDFVKRLKQPLQGLLAGCR